MKKIIIIGGGASGISLGLSLAKQFDVAIYDKEKQLGQKLLIAGKGGFNISNALSNVRFTKKYTPSSLFEKAINQFNSVQLRQFLKIWNIDTYVGTSGKIFPVEGISAYDILTKIRKELLSLNVKIHTNHKFIDFNENEVTFISDKNKINETYDYLIFAMGGASWKITGSDGKWTEILKSKGINIIPFQASNCGINIDFPNSIIESHSGKPLKNIAVSIVNTKFQGEAIITNNGLEGNAIYPTVPLIRKAVSENRKAEIIIDFKPRNTEEELIAKARNITNKQYAKIFNLKSHELALIKAYTDKETYLSAELFAIAIKNIKIPVKSLRPIDEAISTVGGVDLNEINEDFSLKKYPKVYAIGEMLDWDAPTGGFLIQGCVSSAVYVSDSILKKR